MGQDQSNALFTTMSNYMVMNRSPEHFTVLVDGDNNLVREEHKETLRNYRDRILFLQGS